MRTRLRAFAVIFTLISVTPLGAQSAEHDAAYAVVTKLFDAMRARDTASMRAAFTPDATLQSVTPTGIRRDAIDEWITSVARAPDGLRLDERLGDRIVQVSGDLATIWVDYWFFAGDRFSHCGAAPGSGLPRPSDGNLR